MVNGGFAYGYLFMSQHHDTPKVFKEFLTIVRPARILEIGTFHGGLTLMLRDIMDEIGLINNPIRTYDINEQEFLKPLVIDRQVEVYTKNLFNNTYSDWHSDNDQQEINDYISRDGITMVLCDGGCKKCEFNIITPLLKNNDIIMAHDYAPDRAYFEKYMQNKIWNWHEIQDSDIIDSIHKCKIEPFMQSSLIDIAWFCGKISYDIE